MLRQYSPPRCRLAQIAPGRWAYVGTVPVGTIAYLDDGPVLVLAWHAREIAAWRRDNRGAWLSRYTAHGGHLALCRELRTGRLRRIADHILRHASDQGRTLDPDQPAPLRVHTTGRADRGRARPCRRRVSITATR